MRATSMMTQLQLHLHQRLQITGTWRFEHRQIGLIVTKEPQRLQQIAKAKSRVGIDSHSVILKPLLVQRHHITIVQHHPVGHIHTPFLGTVEPIGDFSGSIARTTTNATRRGLENLQSNQRQSVIDNLTFSTVNKKHTRHLDFCAISYFFLSYLSR
jgi:hypothetical protein